MVCLFRMPYGFYEIVRFAAAAVFAYLAYNAFSTHYVGRGILFVALAILFQPFFKLALGRTIWCAVDVLVAILLVVFAITALRNR